MQWKERIPEVHTVAFDYTYLKRNTDIDSARPPVFGTLRGQSLRSLWISGIFRQRHYLSVAFTGHAAFDCMVPELVHIIMGCILQPQSE